MCLLPEQDGEIGTNFGKQVQVSDFGCGIGQDRVGFDFCPVTESHSTRSPLISGLNQSYRLKRTTAHQPGRREEGEREDGLIVLTASVQRTAPCDSAALAMAADTAPFPPSTKPQAFLMPSSSPIT